MKNRLLKLSLIWLACSLSACAKTPETIKIKAPTNLKISDGVLSFDSVDNAIEYQLVVDGEEKEKTTKTSFDISKLNTNGYHRFRVKAIYDENTFNYSVSVPYLIDKDSTYTSVNVLNHSFIKEDNIAYTYGDNNFQQLGHSNTTDAVDIGKKCIQTSYGVDYCLLLDEEGTIYSFGGNEFGQLGRETDSSPQPISSIKFQKMSAGNYHSVALSTEGNVYTWGRNDCGQTGNDNNYIPTKLSSKVFTNIYAGYDSTLLIDDSGDVYAMGNNLNKNIKPDGGDFLSFTRLTSKGGYQSAIVTDYGVIALTNKGSIELLNSSLKIDIAEFINIYGDDQYLFARTKENYVYKIDLNSSSYEMHLFKNKALLSFASYKNNVSYITEDIVYHHEVINNEK